MISIGNAYCRLLCGRNFGILLLRSWETFSLTNAVRSEPGTELEQCSKEPRCAASPGRLSDEICAMQKPSCRVQAPDGTQQLMLRREQIRVFSTPGFVVNVSARLDDKISFLKNLRIESFARGAPPPLRRRPQLWGKRSALFLVQCMKTSDIGCKSCQISNSWAFSPPKLGAASQRRGRNSRKASKFISKNP